MLYQYKPTSEQILNREILRWQYFTLLTILCRCFITHFHTPHAYQKRPPECKEKFEVVGFGKNFWKRPTRCERNRRLLGTVIEILEKIGSEIR